MSKKLQWTHHSMAKMRQYGLSRSKLTNLIYTPERKEVGIVPGTTAVMKTNKNYSKAKTTPLFPGSSIVEGSDNFLQSRKFLPRQQKKTPGEVWVMYKDTKTERKIISAWRYPGISKPGEAIPIPEDIRREILGFELRS